jgi:hypothetical protein
MLALLTVGDDPAPTDHLYGPLAYISDSHFVCEHKLLFTRIRLFRYKMRLNHH